VLAQAGDNKMASPGLAMLLAHCTASLRLFTKKAALALVSALQRVFWHLYPARQQHALVALQ